MLNILKRINQDKISARALRDTLDMVVLNLIESTNADASSVFLWNKEVRRFVLAANHGFGPNQIGKLSLGANEGVVAVVAKREEPINLADASNHPAFHFVQGIGEEELHGLLAVPIIHQRKLMGVLVVQKKSNLKFEADDEAFLVTVSAQLSSAIARADASGHLGNDFFGYSNENSQFKGVVGSSGIAIGQAYVVRANANLEAVVSKMATDIDAELKVFEDALQLVRKDMVKACENLSAELRPEERALFDVYLGILDDQALGKEVVELIKQGQWAQGALAHVVKKYSSHFEAMEDPYFRERSSDFRDLGRRVLAKMQADSSQINVIPENAIIIGEELTPTILAEVPEKNIAGLISVRGSANSHIAILARAMGIPTIMGLTDIPYLTLEGKELVVDGYRGIVFCNLTEDRKLHYVRVIKEEAALVKGLESLIELPSVTLDSVPYQLMVNTGLMTDVVRALDRGAEGVGLYRTEVPFMMRDRFPSEFEQTEIYRQQLQSFHPRPVVMRTLDIGGDKSLSYFPISEENPFLGWRGVRVTLDHPEVFLVQVRAMLRASEGLDNLKIMLPMISSIGELEEALHLIYRAVYELQADQVKIVAPQVGMMVEIPSNVYQIKSFALRVDFLSVGSNDLTQYLLAVDRTNPRVADLYDSLHPAVLHSLKKIVDDSNEAGTPISICGEIAGDPIGAVLLVAMGYRQLSMSSTSLLKVKAVLREMDLSWAENMLERVMEMEDQRVIRATVELELIKQGVQLSRLGISSYRQDH